MTEEQAKRLSDEIKGVIDIIALSVATKLQEIAQEMVESAMNEGQSEAVEEKPVHATEIPKPAPKSPLKKPASPAISEDDVRKVLGDKSRAGFTAEVKALISKYGVEKVSQLDPTHYAAIIAEAEGIK